MFAPGINDIQQGIDATHNLLVAHGRALEVLRANLGSTGQVGIVLDTSWVEPASDSPEDAAAARRWDGYFTRIFYDPVFKGEYPADMLELYGPYQPTIEEGDMALISTPIDFLGVNYYQRATIAARPSSGQPGDLALRWVRSMDIPHTVMDWEVYPPGLYNALKRIQADYGPRAIYITENGAAYDDVVSHDGRVHDHDRRAFIEGHLAACHQAIQDGVPLRGYYAWSLFDNFEWARGYSKRFGMIYVDYPTQTRILKDSALWYKDAIRANGFTPQERAASHW